MEHNSWTNNVRNKDVQQRVKDERITYKKSKAGRLKYPSRRTEWIGEN
jgi:hypothetical protein